MFYLSQAEHYSPGNNHLNNSEELLWFSFFLFFFFGPAAWHEEGGEGRGFLVLKLGTEPMTTAVEAQSTAREFSEVSH